MTTPPEQALPAVGDVTEDNAARKLGEQLAALSRMSEFSVAFEASPAGPAGLPRLEDLHFRSQYLLGLPHGGLAGRLERALGELPVNLRAIISKLPDVDSWSVQAGFPWGVAVTVTFKGGHVQDGT
jgi:hypothetical protein